MPTSAPKYTIPGLTTAEGEKLANILQERLNALIDLHLTLKHVHWNVVGPHFIAVHEMIDPHVDEVIAMVDETAERIATLGASPKGTLDCIAAFGRTDFREDLKKFDGLPTLVIHGDSDAIVPFEVSGKRTAESVPGAQLVLVKGAPHGFNASHAAEFNAALLGFLG